MLSSTEGKRPEPACVAELAFKPRPWQLPHTWLPAQLGWYVPAYEDGGVSMLCFCEWMFLAGCAALLLCLVLARDRIARVVTEWRAAEPEKEGVFPSHAAVLFKQFARRGS